MAQSIIADLSELLIDYRFWLVFIAAIVFMSGYLLGSMRLGVKFRKAAQAQIAHEIHTLHQSLTEQIEEEVEQHGKISRKPTKEILSKLHNLIAFENNTIKYLKLKKPIQEYISSITLFEEAVLQYPDNISAISGAYESLLENASTIFSVLYTCTQSDLEQLAILPTRDLRRLETLLTLQSVCQSKISAIEHNV